MEVPRSSASQRHPISLAGRAHLFTPVPLSYLSTACCVSRGRLTVLLNSSHERWLNSLWPSVYVDPSFAVLCFSISLLKL